MFANKLFFESLQGLTFVLYSQNLSYILTLNLNEVDHIISHK